MTDSLAILQWMHVHAERLHLSPSDVTAFLACEHLTTLSLAHARGEIERPEVENEQAELIFRKGLEHERAYLERLRAEGQDRRSRSARPATATTSAPPARPPTRSATARPTSSTRASSRTTAGAASPTSSLPPAGRQSTRRSTPSSRAREARLHPPAPLLQRAARADPGARAGAHPRPARQRRAGVLPARASSPPTTGASARGSSSFVADPPPTEPYPVDHCGICDFKPICDAYWDAVDHLSRVAGRPPDADREARRRRDHDARRSSAARPPSPCPPGINADTLGQDPRAGRAAAASRARPAATRYRLLQPQPEAGFALLPDPSPGDLFFDFEGNPFWDTDGCARVPLGDPRRRRQLRRRCTRTTTTTERHRVRDVRRPRARAARALPRPARLPLRRLRDHRAQAADGPLRHARARARRPAPPRASSSTSTASSATASAPRGRATG